MKRIFLTFLVTGGLAISAQSFAGSACNLLMEGGVAPSLAQAVSRLLEIPENVIQGEASPRWQHFEALAQAYQALHRAPEIAMAEITSILRDEKAVGKGADAVSATPASSYHSGEEKLRQLFRRDLRALNEILPKPFQYRLHDLPRLPVTAPDCVLRAENLMRNQVLKIEPALKKLGPSYKSFAQLDQAIQKGVQANPWFDEIHALLSQSSGTRLSMRRPESARFWLPKTGFQNQRTTGTSRGTYDVTLRSKAEAALLGITSEEFSQLPSDVLPKYGYLRFAASAPYALYSIVQSYGADIFDFKKDRVASRASFTLGDSLNYGMQNKDLSFGKLFTPLSHLPYASLFLHPKQEKDPFVQEIIYNVGKLSYNTFYIELQFFGPLDLDDVETFTFTQNPPAGEFLDELLQRGIAIQDGRFNADHPTPYAP